MATVSGSVSSACAVFGGSSLSAAKTFATKGYACYSGYNTGSLSSMVGMVYPIATGGYVDHATVGTTGDNATLNWNSSGTITNGDGFTQITWLLFGTGSQFQLYLTKTSGDPITSSGLGSWGSMGGWVNLALQTFQFKAAEGTYDIRESTSLETVASGTWRLEGDGL